MIRPLIPVLALAVFLLLLGCSSVPAGEASTQTGKALAEDFISAMNRGDEPAIKAFVEKWCTNAVPAEQRVARLLNLAKQGCPFKLIRVVSETHEEVRALIEDKGGETQGAIFEVKAGKMDRLRFGPPDMLDAPPPKDYSGYADLASLAETVRADTKSPAMGIAVVRGGKTDQAVAGVRSAGGTEKVGVDEPWSIGSIGKSLCTTVIGRLIEMGKLRWEMTLGEAMPGVPMKPEYKSVPMELVMKHRGGIPLDQDIRMPLIRAVAGSETDPMKIRFNYAKNILDREPIAKPGERFAYSNAGYALLSVIAERATGKPYEKLVQELIFEPLGLRHSYTATDSLPEKRPHGHVSGPSGLTQQDFSGKIELMLAGAGGGMWMSLGDLAKFGHAHLEGLKGKDGLLKVATVAMLHRPVAEDTAAGRGYACGWGVEKLPFGTVMHTHNGSNGTMRAQLAVFPDLDLVVASFINVGGELDPSPPLQAVLAVAKKYAKG